MAVRTITAEEKAHAGELLARARAAQQEVESYDQAAWIACVRRSVGPPPMRKPFRALR